MFEKALTWAVGIALIACTVLSVCTIEGCVTDSEGNVVMDSQEAREWFELGIEFYSEIEAIRAARRAEEQYGDELDKMTDEEKARVILEILRELRTGTED